MSESSEPLACPSAPPDADGAIILGVVGGSPEELRLAYLNERVPVTEELLAKTAPVPPTHVLRFAGRCEESKCAHFESGKCRLAGRIVNMLPAVTDKLPPCLVRGTCRWFAQEGAAACMRCPQVVTLAPLMTPEHRFLATGEMPSGAQSEV